MSEAGPNDAQERLKEEQTPGQEGMAENEEVRIAYGITAFVTTEGKFGVEPVGDCGLIESIGLLYQALTSAQGQLYAQQNMQIQFMARQQAQTQQREGIVIANPGEMPDVRATD